MVIKPMIRNNICINSHPRGCRQAVLSQIDKVKKTFSGPAPGGAPRLALVVGCSTGYGLASRVAAAFGYGACTVGVSFEKPGSETKPGTPGFYNNLAFDAAAREAGLVSRSLDGDAFSREMKDRALEAVRDAAREAGIPPRVDLLVYSLASPVRVDPETGVQHRSVIKPIGQDYSGATVDMMTGALREVSAPRATDEEIAATIKVMGGEDWELWAGALAGAGAFAPGARTVAYTYIGPELSWAIYKNGTIGRAKEDLERAARAINRRGAARAWVSVNKAVVTRASAVIPVIPLYVSTLFKVMKERGLHEGCVEQIARLYRERLYGAESARDAARVPVDEAGRVRLDDWEMRPDVQAEVAARMARVTEHTVFDETDVAGFKHDFLEAHGFDVAGIDYDADTPTAGL